MSTRSNIIIVTPENQAHQFYHHCDGYLSGVGEELRCFLNESANYDDLLKKLATPDEYGGYYEDEGKHDQKERDELHGDIEFLYIIKNKKLYYMEIWRSKDYEELRTYKELIDYICIRKHEIDLTKEVTDKGYIYEDNKPEDYETTKTEIKTMNYAEEKARIENEIKRLQSELETLEKTAKKEEWKKSLVDRFAKFLEKVDFSKIDEINVNATTEKAEEPIPPFYQAHFRLSDFINAKELVEEHNENAEPVKVETEPTEPTAEEKTENKFKIGDYVYYQNCGVYGEIIEIKDGIISIKEKDGNIYKVRPEWIYKVEKPTKEPEPETPEEKPVKMKMSLDELIKGME